VSAEHHHSVGDLRGRLDDLARRYDEIRREHAQARVRLTAVAQYEDRLGKLKDRAE